MIRHHKRPHPCTHLQVSARPVNPRSQPGTQYDEILAKVHYIALNNNPVDELYVASLNQVGLVFGCDLQVSSHREAEKFVKER